MPRGLKKSIPLPEYYIRLKDVRLSLGLDIKDMANLAGLPLVTYLNYERQMILEMAPEVLANFSIKLGLSVEYLLGLTDVPAAYPPISKIQFIDVIDTTRIREVRLERGITGKAMAEKLDISAGAYSTKELHPETLSFTIIDLIRIAAIFKLPVDYLLKITDCTIPHPAGCHRSKPLKMMDLRKVKAKLGIDQKPANTTDEVKTYCREHYRVREIRLRRGLRQVDVAAALGINSMTYTSWENHLYRMPAYYLIKLANFYGITVDYLVGNSDFT